jgi:phage shock protein PspC (stress-responsive transcriptional regulator)
MSPSIKGPFRSNHGLVMGVLKGLGEHFGIAPWILRLAVLALAVLVAFWPVLAGYLVAALIMPRGPRRWAA